VQKSILRMDSTKQVAKHYKSMLGRVVTLTQHLAENKSLKKLKDQLKSIDIYLASTTSFNVVEFEKLFGLASGLFHNLIRDGTIPDNPHSIKVKSDIKLILQIIKDIKKPIASKATPPVSTSTNPTAKGKVKQLQESVNNLSISNSNSKSNLTQTSTTVDWTKNQDLNEKVRSYHKRYATPPQTNSEERKYFEGLLEKLKTFLGENKLCDRTEYTGSVYESLNICGDILEFDVMFVVRNKNLAVVNSGIPGYGCVKPTNTQTTTFTKLLSKEGFLDPTSYGQYFYGVIDKFLKKIVDHGCSIKQKNHGVACQIDIMKNNEIWFQVDLVPCFEIDKVLYVPKPPKFKGASTVVWRKSYSLEEKTALKGLDSGNGCRKQVIRVTKALFKLHMNGLFKDFTSYCIKTVAFKLNKSNNDISWNDQSLGECLVYFLKEIQQCLKSKRLIHCFETSINLLEHTDAKKCEQMEKTLGNILKNEKSFTDKLSVKNKL